MADVRIKPFRGTRWETVSNVSYLSCNWEVNRAGMLTASMTYAQYEELIASIRRQSSFGSITTVAGMILEYSDPSAGKWGGRITQVSGSNGVISISAMSYEFLLRKQLVNISTTGGAGGNDNRIHPGLVMQRIVNAYNSATEDELMRDIKFPSPVTEDNPFTDSTPGNNEDVKIITVADAYDEVIPLITEDIGYEYNVDAELQITYDRDLGRNKSSTVTLTEGIEVTSASWQDDFSTLTNSLLGYYTVIEEKWNKKRTKVVGYVERLDTIRVDSSSGSIAQFGKLTERRDYPEITKKEAMERQLAMELRTTDTMTPTITVEVVNVNDVWSKFRHGDTVYLRLGYSGYVGKFRVMVRSLDVTRGIMVLSGYGDQRVG